MTCAISPAFALKSFPQVAFIREGRVTAVGKPRKLKRELHLGDTIVIAFQGHLPASSLEILLMKGALRRARRTGMLLKLSE